MIKQIVGAVFAAALAASPAFAADHEVKMLNKSIETGERNVYEPALLKVAVGETVKWLSTDRGHNVEFLKGAVPEGVEPFKSKLNKEVEYTFTQPGIYVYKCTPHFGTGMIGMIVVGDDFSNREAASSVRYPGKAKPRAAALFDSLDGS